MVVYKKRTKGKNNSDIKSKDLYNNYMKNIKPVESLSGGKTIGSYNIKQREYASILRDINKEIVNIVVLENFELILPFRLGSFSMKQRPIRYVLDDNNELITKRFSADYHKTRELWDNDEDARQKKILVFHTNDNTEGYRMLFCWDKYKASVFGIRVYKFLGCRAMKRLSAKYLKNKELRLGFYQLVNQMDRNQIIFNNKNKC